MSNSITNSRFKAEWSDKPNTVVAFDTDPMQFNLGPNLILDDYPNAVGAWSVARRLSREYTGNALRIKKNTGGTITEIGYIDNILNESSIISAIGSDGSTVQTLYDQSGNNLHRIQNTTGNQPRIVNGGVIDKKNGKPAIYFDSKYLTTTGKRALQRSTLITVLSISDDAQSRFWFGGDSTSGDIAMLGTYAGLIAAAFKNGVGGIAVGGSIPGNTLCVVSMEIDATNGPTKLYINSNLTSSENITPFTANLQTLEMGADTGGSPEKLKGYMIEQYLYNNFSSSDRLAIEQDIKSYYSIA